MDSLVLCFWHHLDQQRERLAEARGAGRFASIVPETHHDEIVRGNHQRRLPAGARHVIGIALDWISPVAVEPKESSIDRPIVRGPGGRKRADEFGIALWENALTVPDATLKKEVAKPRPVAPGANFNLALKNFRTDQFRSPWYGCRACRTAPAEEMKDIRRPFFRHRAGSDS